MAFLMQEEELYRTTELSEGGSRNSCRNSLKRRPSVMSTKGVGFTTARIRCMIRRLPVLSSARSLTASNTVGPTVTISDTDGSPAAALCLGPFVLFSLCFANPESLNVCGNHSCSCSMPLFYLRVFHDECCCSFTTIYREDCSASCKDPSFDLCFVSQNVLSLSLSLSFLGLSLSFCIY